MYLKFYNKKLKDSVNFNEFVTDISKIKNTYLFDIKALSFVNEYFSMLLYLYPIKESKYKVLSKMTPDQKYGFLSQHLIKCCYIMNIPNTIINKYKRLKSDYTWYKTRTYDSDATKIKLHDMTLLLLHSCVDDWSKSRIRTNKLNNILH